MKFLLWLSNDCTSLVETAESLKGAGHDVGVLLIQDGVFMADKGCPEAETLTGLSLDVYASKPHVEERGIMSRIIEGTTLVEYPEIIDLMMEKYEKIISL